MAGFSSSTSPEREARTMSLMYFSNEFPNDDLRGLLRRLQDLGKLREYPLLANFVDAATRVLHDEIRKLSTGLRSTLPVFDTIFSVADRPELRKGPLSGSIDGILLCTLELGTYIAYAETNRATVDLASSTNSLAGLGIGLLAASALSISPKLDCLPVAAAEIIRVAFRLGTLVYEVSQDLEPTDFIETL
ncbi:hypothetical protein B9Z65_1393 [Elsinoe australis]|uniref:Starter acyltransferase (SAT) domain-containing protein n=1 Tax=Elsinoe australis TaxID=40998 RepID=A0A2P7YFS3_9PEZI|nr:hypothetical protein B9Z65_1393 [Elsinoe australis]